MFRMDYLRRPADRKKEALRERSASAIKSTKKQKTLRLISCTAVPGQVVDKITDYRNSGSLLDRSGTVFLLISAKSQIWD